MECNTSRKCETQAKKTSRKCETRNRNFRNSRSIEKFLSGFVYSKGFKGNVELATGDYLLVNGQDTWTLKLPENS